MTSGQLYWFDGLYVILLIVVAIVARATTRRIVGAVAGALVAGLAGLGIITLGERAQVWHFVIPRHAYFLAHLVVDFTLCAYVFLIMWRVVRRFGSLGFVITIIVAALIGPLRDYWYMAHFPAWGAYASGPSPVLAISATYVLLIVLGYGVMRLVAGPACEDRLSRWPWNAAERTAGTDR